MRLNHLRASLVVVLLVTPGFAQETFTIGGVKRTGVHAGGIDILEQNVATGSKTGGKDIFFANTQMGSQQFYQTAQCKVVTGAHSCTMDLGAFYPIHFMEGWKIEGMTGPSFGQTSTQSTFAWTGHKSASAPVPAEGSSTRW